MLSIGGRGSRMREMITKMMNRSVARGGGGGHGCMSPSVTEGQFLSLPRWCSLWFPYSAPGLLWALPSPISPGLCPLVNSRLRPWWWTGMFVSVQGPVSFDENGDRRGLTQIEQLQVDDEVQVGVYNPFSTCANKIQWDEHRTVLWKGHHSFADLKFITFTAAKTVATFAVQVCKKRM